MSDMENGMVLRQSPMEILGMDQGWVRNECGLDWRIGHGYGLMDGVIGKARGVCQLSVLLIASGFGQRLNFPYERLVPTGVVPCSLFSTSTMSSLTLSRSPMPASCNVEELSKKLKIAKKRQEAECTVQLQCKEEKE